MNDINYNYDAEDVYDTSIGPFDIDFLFGGGEVLLWYEEPEEGELFDMPRSHPVTSAQDVAAVLSRFLPADEASSLSELVWAKLEDLLPKYVEGLRQSNATGWWRELDPTGQFRRYIPATHLEEADRDRRLARMHQRGAFRRDGFGGPCQSSAG